MSAAAAGSSSELKPLSSLCAAEKPSSGAARLGRHVPVQVHLQQKQKLMRSQKRSWRCGILLH